MHDSNVSGFVSRCCRSIFHLCLSSLHHVAALLGLSAAQRTPHQLLDGFVGVALAAHFAKPGPAKGVCASPGAARTHIGPRNVGAKPRSPGGDGEEAPLPRGGSKAKGRVSGYKSGVFAAIGERVHNPFSWPGHGKKHPVPVSIVVAPCSRPVSPDVSHTGCDNVLLGAS